MMKFGWKTLDRLLALAAAAMAVASLALNDADKSPLYILLAYALGRLSTMKYRPGTYGPEPGTYQTMYSMSRRWSSQGMACQDSAETAPTERVIIETTWAVAMSGAS